MQITNFSKLPGKSFQLENLFGSRRLRSIVVLVLLLLLGFLCARLVWILLTPASKSIEARLAEPVNEVVATGGGGGTIDIASLESIKLFGEGSADADADGALEELEDDMDSRAVDTKLQLTLKGVMYDGRKGEGGAIIAQAASQKFYQVGDQLDVSSRVKLVEVMTDRVILDNNGRFERLWLFDVDAEPLATRNSASPPISRMQRGVSQDEVDDLLSDIQTVGFDAISEVLRFSPARADGVLQGYRVAPGPQPELFKKLGFQPGDIITAVNGMPLDNPQSTLDAMRELQTIDTANLDITRGDRTLSLTISVE